MARRRGFQHDRVAEVEHALRRPMWLAIAAAVAAVLIGLPGPGPFQLGSARIAGLTFTRFVFYGSHPQSIGLDGLAALVALLTLAGGFGAAYLMFSPARGRAAVATSRLWPLRVAERGFYVERFTELATIRLLVIAGRVSAFDEQVTAPITTSLGESVDEGAAALGAFRNARFARYLAGGLVVIAILALLSVLAATGHLGVHLA